MNDDRSDPRDLGALGLLVLLIVVLFHRVLLEGRILYARDINAYFYPLAAILTRVLHEGSWPLWNPYVAFGQPLLANPQFEVFYPPTWLIPVTSPWTYYTGFVVLHCLIGAAGVYVLCRTIGLSPAGAFLGSAAWLTSGPWLSLVNLWHHMAGAAWMPWTLVAAERCFLTPRLGRALLWGTVVAVQLLAGSADMAIMSAVLAGGRLVVHLARRRQIGSWRALLLAAAAAVAVAVGLAAAQWLPTLELGARSARSTLRESDQMEWSVHPLFLLQAVVAVPFKDLRLGPMPSEVLFQSREPLLFSLYLGLPAAGLVVAAMGGRGAPWKGYVTVALVVAVLITLGRYGPVYGAMLHLLPPLRMLRYPMKVMAVVALLWSLLVGVGFDEVRREGERTSRWVSFVLGLAGAVVTAAAVGLYVHPAAIMGWVEPEPGQTLRAAIAPLTERLLVSGILSLVLAALLALRRAGRRVPFTGLAAACVIIDLLTFHIGLNDTAPRDVLSFRPPILNFVSSTDHSRVYAFDYSLPSRIPAVAASAPHLLSRYDVAEAPGWLMAVAYRTYLYPTLQGVWGIEGSYDRDLQSFYPSSLAMMTRVIRAAEGLPVQVRLLQVGAVSRVISLHASGFPGLFPIARLPGLFRAPILVSGVPDPLPRTYVVGGARVADDPAAIALLLSDDFDPRREVALAPTGGGAPSARDREGPPAGGSRIALWRPDRVRIEAEATRAGYVVLVDSYDPGWRATLDGQPVPILRANVAFRAVAVEAGTHVIDFIYRPRSVAWGMGLSTLTLAGVVIVAARLRRRDATVEDGAARDLRSSAPRF